MWHIKKSDADTELLKRNTGHYRRCVFNNTQDCSLREKSGSIFCNERSDKWGTSAPRHEGCPGTVQLESLRLSAVKSEDMGEHVWLMLPVSVNTPSHLQSAETLVCLHCLADCLPNTHTHYAHFLPLSFSHSNAQTHSQCNYKLRTTIHRIPMLALWLITDRIMFDSVFPLFRQRTCWFFTILKH